MTQQVLATIRKNRREEIRVVHQVCNKHEFVSIRTWFEAPDGTMRPGGQGIEIRLSLLQDVSAALVKVVGDVGAVKND